MGWVDERRKVIRLAPEDYEAALGYLARLRPAGERSTPPVGGGALEGAQQTTPARQVARLSTEG